MDKKYYNYLYSLIILNNINAGCKNCKGKNKDKTEQKKNINNQLNEEDSEKPIEDPNKDKDKDPKETEEEKKKRLEEERLESKANEIKYFFSVLNKIYLDPKNKTDEVDKIDINIKATIDENGLKEAIKYFENLNFNDTIDDNYVTNVLTNLYNIFNIENVDKKNEINKEYKKNIFYKYLVNLIRTNKDNKILIVKNKNNNEIHFLLQECQDGTIEYNNENYDILEIFIHTIKVAPIKKSEDEKKKYTDVEMYLAIDLSKNKFVNFNESLGVSKTILNHIYDSKKSLPGDNVCSSYVLNLLNEKIDNYYFIYTNNYIYNCSKNKPNTDNLYDFEHVIKMESIDNYNFKFSEEIGKKKSNLGYYYKDAPFSFETYEKICTTLGKLKDINKITEVQNDLLKLVKEDKIYSGQKIKKENYDLSSNIKFTKFEDTNKKNTDRPYTYNIYIYKDNNEIKVDIKKWEDNEENTKFIKQINNFEANLTTLFGAQNYQFNSIVKLIYNINKDSKKYGLNNIIKIHFSRILTKEEWDKLDTRNLCIKIADDLSLIELGKDIAKGDNFKVFLLNKNTINELSYFLSEERTK